MYHVDHILRETAEVANNGFYEIYVNTQIDDGSDIAELMKIFKSTEVLENSKFPRICFGIKNLKIGKLTIEEIASSIPLLSIEEIMELQKSL